MKTGEWVFSQNHGAYHNEMSNNFNGFDLPTKLYLWFSTLVFNFRFDEDKKFHIHELKPTIFYINNLSIKIVTGLI